MYGIGGALGIIDILFILRASVGLMVRAASPVAWALLGIMDSLLLDEGVIVLCILGLPGDREPLDVQMSVSSDPIFGVKI